MTINTEDVSTLTNINGFTPDDAEHLRHLGQLLIPKLPEITDRFYERLLADDRTRPFIEGRVECLKKTHISWMTGLFNGVYDHEFMITQKRIGERHVAVGISPLFVAASMSFLRATLPGEVEKIAHTISEPVGTCTGALLRLLDLCQYLIDSAYEAERMRRLSSATGMRPALLENLIALRPTG